MIKTIALKNVPVGKNFKIWNREFTVLKQEYTETLVLQNECATMIPFGDGDNDDECKIDFNNFTNSKVRDYLDTTYINSLKEAGADIENDIIPQTVDLKCTLGTREYGIVTVKAGLLTLEQYGKFSHIIPQVKNSKKWWLATPYGTVNYNSYVAEFIWTIFPNEEYNGVIYYDSCGVRPTLNLNPELKVFYEDDSTDTDDNNDSGNWSNYIKYLHKWAVEHDVAEFKGCSPACYDEWRDMEDNEENA